MGSPAQYSKNNPYVAGDYYCSTGHHPVPKGAARLGVGGKPLCPDKGCTGYGKALRTKPTRQARGARRKRAQRRQAQEASR